jgi:predicted P-loop ATPase
VEPPLQLLQAVGARSLIGAIARIYDPGCKNDCSPTLVGDQGELKSSAIKALFEPWFTDEISDFGSKDAAMQTAGVWGIEIGELVAARRDVDRTKAFMSRSTDRFRPPYGKPFNYPHLVEGAERAHKLLRHGDRP